MIENEIAKLEKPDQDAVAGPACSRARRAVVRHRSSVSVSATVQPPVEEVRPRSGHSRCPRDTARVYTSAEVARSRNAVPPRGDGGPPVGPDATAPGRYGLDLKSRTPARDRLRVASVRSSPPGGRRGPRWRSRPASPDRRAAARPRSRDGDVDTVVVAFPDMQGRLQGKRIHAQFFLDTVLEHGTEGCNYLLAVDVDMNTVDGYAISSWERGYGDLEFVLDLDTLHPVPWMPGTAMVICDLAWLDDGAHRRGREPAADPAGPGRARRRAGAGGLRRDRARVHRVQRHLRAGLGRRLPRPDPGEPVQRGLLAARHQPGRAAAARHPQRHVRRRAWSSSRPRASATSASTRSPSSTTRWCEPPTSTRSTRTARRRSPRSTARRSPSWRSSTSARATRATST